MRKGVGKWKCYFDKVTFHNFIFWELFVGKLSSAGGANMINIYNMTTIYDSSLVVIKEGCVFFPGLFTGQISKTPQATTLWSKLAFGGTRLPKPLYLF